MAKEKKQSFGERMAALRAKKSGKKTVVTKKTVVKKPSDKAMAYVKKVGVSKK